MSEREDLSERTIYLIYNPARADKLLPLLESYRVIRIENVWDIVSHAVAPPEGQRIVIVDSFGRFAFLALLANWLLSASLVVRPRGDVIRENKSESERTSSIAKQWRMAFGLSLIKENFQRCDLALYNSEYAQGQLEPHVNPAAKQEVVYNPFIRSDAEEDCEIEGLDGALNLLTVTNMDFAAKVFPTMEAITEWVNDNLWEECDVRWVVLGSGKYLDEVRRRVKKRMLEDRVRVPGWVDNPAPYYRQCDAYVHFTRLDNFPNTTMEAMSFHKPVITNADSCGVREQVFDGVNGFVVAEKREFMKRIRQYAGSESLRAKHGDAGAQMIEREWSVEKQRDRMEETIQRLVDC